LILADGVFRHFHVELFPFDGLARMDYSDVLQYASLSPKKGKRPVSQPEERRVFGGHWTRQACCSITGKAPASSLTLAFCTTL
jgi:hypothetical protein